MKVQQETIEITNTNDDSIHFNLTPEIDENVDAVVSIMETWGDYKRELCELTLSVAEIRRLGKSLINYANRLQLSAMGGTNCTNEQNDTIEELQAIVEADPEQDITTELEALLKTFEED